MAGRHQGRSAIPHEKGGRAFKNRTMARRNKAVSTAKYVMKISRLTVDKLGVQLYDRVSAVIAELVANSYDADATKVTITAPMGEYLATRSQGEIKDRGYE